MTVTDAPTNELGTPGGIAPSYGSLAGGTTGYYVEGLESNADLRFPASAVVYDRMRKEDGQVASVARAITYPVLNANRRLVGGSDEVRRFVERELGLDLSAEEQELGRRRRRREGIVLREHMREALLSLWFGFMPFEQVYEVGPAAPGLEDAEQPGRLYAHLRKLAPRMPRTLSEVRTSRDGGLAGVVQLGGSTARLGYPGSGGTFIGVERLVMYVNEREGADWTGNSLLRAAYKHWLIKDALIRLGAQIVERNGMGIPFVTGRPDQRTKGLALAKALRAGAEAGAFLEEGMTVSIVGVAGSTADELPRVKYHDEAIGRSLLAMFLNLGHDNGARALGATFVDYFLLAVNSIIRNLDETITEHIIRDLVELNYGPDEAYPVLVTDDLTAEATPTAEALKALADAGLITADRDLEQDIRRRYKLPAKPEAQGEQALDDAAGNPFASVGIPALIEAGVITEDEGRQMLKIPGNAPGVPGTVPIPGAVEYDPAADDEGSVVLPFALAANLTGNREAIRTLITTGDYRLDDEGLTTALEPTGDDLVDRLAAITAAVTALRAGHAPRPTDVATIRREP